jgi:hypothetical protein
MMVVLLGAGIWYWDSYMRKIETYSKDKVERWGAMEEVTPVLTKSEVTQRALSFKFFRHGRKSNPEAVEAIGADGRCTYRNNEGTLYKSPDPSDINPGKECRWEFVRDSQGNVIYEKALDMNGKPVWGIVYSPLVKGEPHRAHYIDA